MNRKQVIAIAIISILIAACWAVLAFFIREELISRFALWSSLIIGTATAVTSFVALYISFLSYKQSKELAAQKGKDNPKNSDE